MENRKELILDALRAFVAQRPGMDPRDYDAAGYRSESRAVTRDRHQAETLLNAVAWRDGITADALLKASRSAYSGRLTIVGKYSAPLPPHSSEAYTCGCGIHVHPKHKLTEPLIAAHATGCPFIALSVGVGYCTGQYFPTEYRRAVCAVLASALWDYVREHCMPKVAGYRVESWTELGKGRRLHTVRDTRKEADTELAKLGGSTYGSVNEVYLTDRYMGAGDWLRAHFRKEFGRTMQERWFS